MKKTTLLLSIIMLSACSSSSGSVEDYLTGRKIPLPTKDSFISCRGYGCPVKEHVELTKKEWRAIDRIFTRKRAKTPEAERKKIALAIAQFEEIVGPITGTHHDIGGSFKKTGPFQQDCVDESTNTSIYLSVLAQRGRMKFHDVLGPTMRAPLGSWPHQAARIMETETGDIFVVDSWFHDNGHNAEIVTIKEWKKGWKPEESSGAVQQSE